MSHDESPSSQYGRIAKLRGYLPLNYEDASPMATHGSGALTGLIRSRSNTSLHNQPRRGSVLRGRDAPDEEAGVGESPPRIMMRNARESNDAEDDRHSASNERHFSAVLFSSQMRSQRLIGNSNPRYRWQRYWKTEQELSKMKKPM